MAAHFILPVLCVELQLTFVERPISTVHTIVHQTAGCADTIFKGVARAKAVPNFVHERAVRLIAAEHGDAGVARPPAHPVVDRNAGGAPGALASCWHVAVVEQMPQSTPLDRRVKLQVCTEHNRDLGVGAFVGIPADSSNEAKACIALDFEHWDYHVGALVLGSVNSHAAFAPNRLPKVFTFAVVHKQGGSASALRVHCLRVKGAPTTALYDRNAVVACFGRCKVRGVHGGAAKRVAGCRHNGTAHDTFACLQSKRGMRCWQALVFWSCAKRKLPGRYGTVIFVDVVVEELPLRGNVWVSPVLCTVFQEFGNPMPRALAPRSSRVVVPRFSSVADDDLNDFKFEVELCRVHQVCC